MYSVDLISADSSVIYMTGTNTTNSIAFRGGGYRYPEVHAYKDCDFRGINKTDIKRKFTGKDRGADADICEPYSAYISDPEGWSPLLVPPEFCEAQYYDSHPIGTKAEYMQYVLELEYPLFFGIQLST